METKCLKGYEKYDKNIEIYEKKYSIKILINQQII